MTIRLLAYFLMAAALLISARGQANPASGAAGQPCAGAAKAEARTLFALLLRPGVAWKGGRPFAEQGLRPHFDYWMRLFRAGRVASAGPLGSDSGLVLLLARDLAEAEAIARADPAVVARIFTGEVRPYAPPMIDPAVLRGGTGAR